MMLLLAILLLAAAIWSLLRVLDLVGTTDKAVTSRLKTGNRKVAAAVAPPKRLILTTDVRLGLKKLVSPGFLITRNERNMVLAGRPPGWTIPRMLVAKAVLTGTAILLMLAMIASSSNIKIVVATSCLVFVAYVLPDVLLQSKAQERQKQIEIDLPDVLDQATIAIESGLSFEAALARVGSTAKGPLADEIVRTVQDMRLGISRRDAYAALSKRTSCLDLQRFTKSIVQAEEFGVPVANVVRTLAKEMRIKRRYRAEAKALQIPVKMLFPLLVCIFPVMFIVVLFPAFANLGTTLAGK